MAPMTDSAASGPVADPIPGPVFPQRLTRTRLYEQVAEQITTWIADNGLGAGDRLPPERELATRLGVSRATLSQALVALEVIGVVAVRHGDGTVVTGPLGATRIVEAIRSHADRLPEVIETRDALETKIAALAATRRTDDDLARIDDALTAMAADIEAGGRGVEGDERFHGAVTAAAHSLLLARLMDEIADLIKETRIESLIQPGRPRDSLAGHQAIADAIRAGDPSAASTAMHAHVAMVSDVALLREHP
ncbi:GntR family transcriptional regulator [Nocardioides psychrotolerans]|uniref:GntR family transcriptional regulator, transcriptional repressor for pyruvate dehydrogenase complex n=2 Tax=Nocardioides psychrotolerans TaxID=1005945 RepID=A0A1I3MEN9_9ACTN|nr:GntR family transcriptional regulator [Nocardioides psychrotolerans]SFI95412.1 GntR family transcriptional regulator, transcriptional repressor for pyruvate dehydrogenase complex [Nocardioides psychrotolerans]